MAETTNGIYYPTDGTQAADVLADMKKMAESMEEAINNNKFNPKEINDNITKIQEEQTTQNKAIEENTRSIEKNAESIEQNTTDITKLQEDNEKLKAQIPKGQASGEEISLQDSAEMPLVDFFLQGNSKQNTREGYNLANYNTTSSVSNFEIGDIKSGSNYTLSFNIKGTSGYNLRTKVDGSMVTNIATKHAQTGNQLITFTATEDAILYINGFEGSSGFEFNQIMLLEGTYTSENLPAFEEYGVMPSLNYPSEVEAVGDNINIFDDTVEKVTSIINDSGNEVADTGTNDFYKQIIIPDSKKYIMSYEKNNQGFVRMAYYNGDTFISRQYSNQNGFIFTVPDNCNKIDCRTNAGTNNEIKFTNLKIEKGEVATSYSPYNQGSVGIVKSNRNILDLGQTSKNNITINKNKITVNSPIASVTANDCNLLNNKFISSKTLVFTFIANGTISTGSTMQLLFRTKKNSYKVQKIYQAKTYENDISHVKVTFDSDETVSEVYVYISDANINMTLDVQAEITDIATNFIEHKGNTYTLPIQKPFYMLHFDGDVNISQKATVRDSFILKDGKWCEKHNIAKVNLEDINWYKGSAEAGTENTYKRWNSIAKYKDDKCGIAGSSNRLAISNYLANQYYKIFNVDKIGFNIENSEICIRFPISTANSPEEIKNFWQEKANEGNGAYILYPSKEPELTECTEEQVQVLEQIVKDGTYKGVTHYFTEDEVKPTLELKYYRDLETIINKQEQLESTLNNVQAQILELGGK